MGQNIRPSARKKDAIDLLRRHVFSGKTAFFRKYGMDFVMGRR